MSTAIDSSHLLTQMLGDEELTKTIKKSHILLVGAGGIGSEVIKNLLLMGFEKIKVIDLDTIDVSNLNRQFLFNRQHVGKSKAEIASRVAKDNFGHNDTLTVEPIHDSIQSRDYDIDFYKEFTLVINALDNRAARSHVNRMCLAADIPLIESGSEGYMGQVFLINKHITQCYECEGPKQDSRTYASCTIRNTPSLPIHCIVWAKHLFAQLFGEVDVDNDVSPDMNDPELTENKTNESNVTNGKTRLQSTRDWVQKCDYNTKEVFDKLFQTDIEYLLKMDKLWESRRKPFSINYDKVVNNEIQFDSLEATSSTHGLNGSTDKPELKDQILLSIKDCLEVLDTSIKTLKDRLKTENFLVWDKDDEPALDFVTAVSNLRSFCFHISRKSKFDVKSMAGNIIPAISSTNSIVGGLMILQCLNVLRNITKRDSGMAKEEADKELYDSCRHIYLRKVGPSAKNLIASYQLEKPNLNCLVCSSSVPEIEISLRLSETLMTDFIDQIIYKKLHYVCPDITIDGTSVILYTKEDYDDMDNEARERFEKKYLSDYKDVSDKTRVSVNDLLQDLQIIITLRDVAIDKNENDGLFYKMVITKEGITKNEQTNDETIEDSNENKVETDSRSDDMINDDVIQVEDENQNNESPQVEGLDPMNEANEVEEVINGFKSKLGDFNDNIISV
ncbi:SUMO-activating enzyme subunit 2-like isoform X2 [Oppia nitens]|uniref:SUMO-activating enzyme subunit 2-like isoform X2 n=1 Tax=Oppia nitens TaxID=1686743 RepID=UPI0023DAF179|nr:SUMO-activating enzyme subunit 2-like isoform X2 [Oppia nitens]